jgi:(p)ppGpp synthase/HD superfamily hydrolase
VRREPAAGERIELAKSPSRGWCATVEPVLSCGGVIDDQRPLTAAAGISLVEADALAARLLAGLRTKLGGAHIAHARRVAAGVLASGDTRAVAAALLHDVLEKTPVTADELHEMTGDQALVELVERLTRKDGQSDWSYLSRCAADPTALLIKRLDLTDKLTADDTEVPAADAERIRRRARQHLALLERLASRPR